MSLSLFNGSGCRSQDKNTPGVDRQPWAAGKFYPGNEKDLRAMLGEMFAQAKPRSVPSVIAVICPHAGYDYSGVVAASSINQVDPDKAYDNVFVIGSSHHVSFMGASVYNAGDYYITPLGKVRVNTELANALIKSNAVFSYQPDADQNEHSVEVQVPFLQYHLKKPFKLVPIVLGTQSEQSCKKIAQTLKPYFNERNLFVISTDFSHYPAYNDAIANDKRTCDAILTNSVDAFLKILKDNADRDIPDLATSCCGWTSVTTLLYLTAGDPSYKYTPVLYKNSGDSRMGEKSQVVGYWSVAVSFKEKDPQSSAFSFTEKDKKDLLAIARKTLQQYIRQDQRPVIDTNNLSPAAKMHAGAFVTLKENGELRGCIGRFTSDLPLYEVVSMMTIESATEDNRFPRVEPKEVDNIEIEISVLSPMRKITSIDEITLGRDGIYIKKGYMGGTFLPQVASETGWTKEEFLGHCARDKAGIGWDGWKTADIYTYQACVFSESEVIFHKKK